ncbi:homocitrate synthase family protein [Methanococcus voltae]|uniref:Methanogen homocitrate synthase n=2 Tax=Methanococcus voltae TaxID=2188 RepID=A0A8J7RP87_METVO|nr:homocitrate synthase family protein [Methanococcus voltae]MBP2172836.1 methanogen homocitrate synthase [Methanococcus voltae]MBP2201754.1 methanogen homocitrate synthase [Methanococcus voltae]MCS3922542.1 methanogen homocitrate synthase [Methanococcus voltae PS]
MEWKATCPYNPKLDLKDCYLYDTTLRDGEQTPGICFTKEHKLDIAKKLDDMGVKQIEAGFPVVSASERDIIKTISSEGLNAEILALCRVVKDDIDKALECDVDGIITFIATSPMHLKYKLHKELDEVEQMGMDAIEYAKEHGLFVAFSAEDATRTPIEDILRIHKNAEEHGANRVHVADTVGCATPQAMHFICSELSNTLKKAHIGVHCHNDFGLAAINSIYGLMGGAKAVSTTINGLGERAGNAPLEEFVMTLKALYEHDMGLKTEKLKSLSQTVEEYSKIKLAENKPIVGNIVFYHESGIHVDAVLENPLTYEPVLPEVVGQERKIILGKHSGCKAVASRLMEQGIETDREHLWEIVKKTKETRESGVEITDNVFKNIVHQILDDKK